MSSEQSQITVILPAYNEALRIRPCLDDLASYALSHDRIHKILIVDDGSTDKTVEIVRSYSKNNPLFELMMLPCNQGKGGAVRAGLIRANTPFVMFMDADGSFSSSAIDEGLKLLDVGADAVIGCRFAPQVRKQNYESIIHRILRWSLTTFIAMMLKIKVRDSQCGFKMFKTDSVSRIVPFLRVNDMSFDLEILSFLHRSGCVIRELPILYKPIKGSKVHFFRDTLSLWREIHEIRKRDDFNATPSLKSTGDNSAYTSR